MADTDNTILYAVNFVIIHVFVLFLQFTEHHYPFQLFFSESDIVLLHVEVNIGQITLNVLQLLFDSMSDFFAGSFFCILPNSDNPVLLFCDTFLACNSCIFHKFYQGWFPGFSGLHLKDLHPEARKSVVAHRLHPESKYLNYPFHTVLLFRSTVWFLPF